MRRTSVLRRMLFPLLAVALVLADNGAVAPEVVASTTLGTLKVERHGDHGRPVILISGLAGGPWVWRQTIAALQTNHVVYAVTLAGFDGMPAPVGQSLGGTLALRFAGEYPELIAGVAAVDGLPSFPGMDRIVAAQRLAMPAGMRKQVASATPEQFKAQQLGYMQKIGVIDPALAARYGPFNARSDVQATAEYMTEDLDADGRPALKHANVSILEISPYNAPDFSRPPMAMMEQQKADYYRSLLANAPNARVVSISPSQHFVMLDQPAKFQLCWLIS